MAIQSINPATEEVLNTYEYLSDATLTSKIEQAQDSFLYWNRFTFEQRGKLLYQLADQLMAEQNALAETITKEIGKPIKQARGEVEKCAKVCRYYADNGAKFLENLHKDLDTKESYVRHEPLGVIYSVMPWNFPYWQFFRFGAPALMAGNTILMKHAGNVPGCALNIESLFAKAGFPENVFQNLFIDHAQSDYVVQSSYVKGVTFTGSTAAGSHVAGKAANHIKKTVLELGGSDPFIVMPDADLDAAAEQGVIGRMQNTGQSCIAAKRFLIHKDIKEDFLNKFKSKIRELQVGDPMDEANYIGPMAREDLRACLRQQVDQSVDAGAELLVGGDEPEGPGYFYNPTIISGIKPGMRAYNEELFGPVASVFEIGDKEEAIHVANDTAYGLGASVWSSDIDQAKEIGRQIETGTVAINGIVKSYTKMPFGGVKQSGYGRELSEYGILEFVNIKTMNVY